VGVCSGNVVIVVDVVVVASLFFSLQYLLMFVASDNYLFLAISSSLYDTMEAGTSTKQHPAGHMAINIEES
jgi:hypothetical protein